MAIVASQLVGQVSIVGADQSKATLLNIGQASQQAQDQLNKLQSAAKDAGSILGSRLASDVKNAQSGLQDLSKRASDAGLDISKFTTLQQKASEAAAKLGMAQAQAADATAKADAITNDASASAEKVALAQARAAVAAENVQKAELAASDAMAQVSGEATRLADALDQDANSAGFFERALGAVRGVLSGVGTGMLEAEESSRGLFSGITEGAGKFLDFGAKAGQTIFGLQMFTQIAEQAASAILTPGENAEQTETAFDNLLGSTKAASDEMSVLATFASHTPFETLDIDKAAEQLIGFGENAKNVVPELTSIGDALSAVGRGSAANLESVVNVFGKIDNQGKLTGEAMQELADNGVNAWAILEQQTGKTQAQISDMISKGVFPAKDAIEDLTAGIEANPIYAGGMAKQSQTLTGIFSTLKSNFDQVLAAFDEPIMKSIEPLFAGLASQLSSPAFKQFATTIGDDVVGALKNTSAFITGDVVPAFQRIGGFINDTLIPGFHSASDWLNTFTGHSQESLPILAALGAMLAYVVAPAVWSVASGVIAATWPILLIGAAVGGLTAIFLHFYNSNAGFKDFIDNIGKSFLSFWNTLSTNFIPAMQKVGNVISTQVWPILQDVGGFLVTTFKPVWDQLVTTFQTQLLPAWNNLMTALKPAMPLFQLIGEIIGGVLVIAFIELVAVIGGIVGAIAGALPGIIQAFGGIVQAIAGALQFVIGIVDFFVDLFTGKWSNLGNDLKTIWGGIAEFFGGIWNIIAGIFNAAVGGIIGAVKGTFGTIWAFIGGIFTPIGKWFSDRFTEARNGITSAIGNVGQWFQDRWHDIENVFAGIGKWFADRWNEIYAPLKPIGDYMGAVFETIGRIVHAVFDKIGGYFHDRFTEAWNAVTAVFGFFGGWFTDRWHEVQAAFGFVGNWFHDRFTEAWNGIVFVFTPVGKWFSDRWHDVQNVFAFVGNWFHDRFQEAWTKITILFAPLGNWFHDRWTDIVNGAEWLKNTIMGKFNDLKTGAGNIFKGLVNGIIDQLNNGISAAVSFINFFARGLDDLAKSLTGTEGNIPIIQFKPIPHYASGTDAHPGGPAIVGEEGREMVWLPAGAQVVPNGITEMLLSMFKGGIPGYANGIGDIGNKIMQWVAGGAQSVLDNLLSTLHISTPQIIGLSNIASGLMGKIKDYALGFINGILPKFSVGGQAVNVPGNVASWIAQAMAITGVPGSWLSPLEVIAMHESGGNANSINRWDSNALAGHPSQGLFQMIPSTFAAHMISGHTNILNPIDSSISAIRYIQGRYGDVFHVPGILALNAGKNYVGYANGGVINEPIAGVGLHTGTNYAFGERGPEMVSPYIPHGVNLSQMAPTINVHNTIVVQPNDFNIDGRRMNRALQPYHIEDVRRISGANI